MPKLSYRINRRTFIKRGIHLLGLLVSLKIIGVTPTANQPALAQASVPTLAYGAGVYGAEAYGRGIYAVDQEFRVSYQSYLPLVSK